MDARFGTCCAEIAAEFALLAMGLVPFLAGASFRSTNFAVEAPSREVAQRVAEQAEACRASIAKSLAGARFTAPGARPARSGSG